MFVTKAFLLFGLALSASGLSVPHINARNAVHHRSIAASAPVAEPEPIVQPESVVVKPKRKRNLNKRCAVSSDVPSAASSSLAPSSSVIVDPVSSVVSSAVASITSPISVIAVSSVDPVSSVIAGTSSVIVPTSTSVYVAPTSTEAASTIVAAATTSEAESSSYVATPTAAADSSEPTWMYATNSGDGTYYAAGLGACGITNTDSDYIVAVSWELFDNYPGYDGTNPNTNPVCNKGITASYGGKSVSVTVTDRCTGCSTTSLDFTPTAFGDLADLSIGRLTDVTWEFTS
ncbi:uncharacterized protein LAESUDRAFT_726515 [Laetiporus sulphureus 93-53]|uniref:RlpA-like protein double-psi beta-barrel domain-containing protein n=1 Tax=Laetiporus sulphureus 93-53 TaxID=1314785 RepID=A0A165DZC8_9APHY|nr:uncharacterized protein LAESUDRAFT_726515 [Laetiporus sulphureus 93-53]KZT05947.1 hypothetical protein LAESUDRAFT_726515 [Laetiporus sulphureus 93-53]